MQVVLDGLPIGLVLVAGVFAPLAGWMALRKARHPIVWFVLGAMIGPLALGILVLAPPGRCSICDEPVRGWPVACAHCGARLRGDPTTAGSLDTPAARSSLAPAGDPGSGSAVVGQTGRPQRPTARPALRRDPRRRPSARAVAMPLTRAVPRPLAPLPAAPPTTLPTARPPSEGTAGQVLATGLYLSGNGGLEVGATYALSLAGDRLRIFGPVDTGQLTVRQEGPVADFEVTAIDDRVIISGRSGRSSLAIVFRMVGGMRPSDLEAALGTTGTISRATS